MLFLDLISLRTINIFKVLSKFHLISIFLLKFNFVICLSRGFSVAQGSQKISWSWIWSSGPLTKVIWDTMQVPSLSQRISSPTIWFEIAFFYLLYYATFQNCIWSPVTLGNSGSWLLPLSWTIKSPGCFNTLPDLESSMHMASVPLNLFLANRHLYLVFEHGIFF